MRKFWFGTVAAIVFLGFSHPAFGQENPKAIIEKAVKAYGGLEKLAKMKTTHMKTKGTIDLFGGINFTQDATIQLPNKFREAIQMDVMGQQVNVTTVFNGEKGWIKVNDMDTMDMDDNILEIMRDAVYAMRLVQQVFLLNEKEFEVAPLGEIKVNDRPSVGIKVNAKGKKEVSMYFDRETGLMSRFDHRTKDAQSGEEVAEERIILEYQDIDGFKTAKRVLVNRDGKKFTEVEILEVKISDKADDGDFTKP